MSQDTDVSFIIRGGEVAVRAAIKWQKKKERDWKKIQKVRNRGDKWMLKNGYESLSEFVTWGMDFGEVKVTKAKRASVKVTMWANENTTNVHITGDEGELQYFIGCNPDITIKGKWKNEYGMGGNLESCVEEGRPVVCFEGQEHRSQAEIKKQKKAVRKKRTMTDADRIEAAIRKTLRKPKSDLTQADLGKVTKLSLDVQLTDISALSGLKRLKELNFDRGKIADLNALAGLKQLTHLNANCNKITDLSGLAELNKLESLGLYENSIADVNALAGLKKLKVLDLCYNSLTEASALAYLSNMERLALNDNKLTDLSALAGLKKLKELYITPTVETEKLKKALPKCWFSRS